MEPVNERILMVELERLDRAFPHKDTLTRRELARYDGVDERTLHGMYNFRGRLPIPKIKIAIKKAAGG